MFIYNRLFRFRQVSAPLVKVGGGVRSNYKINRRNANTIIKNNTVRASRPTAQKLKSLTKNNSEFLSQLGFKVLKKK